MAKRGVNNRSKKNQASKPYDVSNSFVKKVASRVTELLPQSIWPSKWFSSGNVDVHPHGNGREILNTPINTENEDADQNPTPAKRARIPLKSNFADPFFSASTSASDYETRRLRTLSSISPVDDAFDEPVAGPSGIQRQCPVETSESLVSKSQDSFCYNSKKLEINGEDHSDSSESTSGCSSLPQADHNTEMRSSTNQAENKERQINGPESVNRSAVKRKYEGAANFSSMAIHGSRLFPGFGSYSPPTRATPVPVGRRRNPSFNPDAFASQQWSGEKTNIKDRIVNSPFYSGRTTYGGVSAYQSSLNRTETQSHYLRGAQRSIQIRPVNTMEAKESSTGMSNTARRIMEALEMFSSPIQDAKKIPLDGSVNMKRRRVLANSDFSRTMHTSSSSHLKEDSTSDLTSHRLGDYAPSVKELTIPTVPDILAMRRRQRLQGSTVAARKMASESCMNSVNIEKDSECDRFPLPYQDKRNSGRCGGKIKSNEEVDEEPNEEPDLPNIALPITSLPKFDFVLQPVLHTSNPPNCCYSNSPPARQVSQSVFKFSSPIAFSSSSDTLVSHSNFTFSSPLKATSEDRIDNRGPTADASSSAAAIKRPFENKTNKDSSFVEFNSMDKERARSLEKAWSKDKVDLKSCSEGVALPKAVQGNFVNLQFSVGSKLSEKEGFGDKFKPSAGTWECVTCMVRNSAEASKCVACETPNSKMCTSESVNIKNASTENKSGFGDRFKPPSGTWSCDVCMVRNPDSANKCQACETARVKGGSSISGTENSKTDDKSVSKSGFGDKFKKPVGDWECTICLVMNKAGGPPKCVACEAPKPGSEPVSAGSTSSSLASKFSFGSAPASSGFNFGIDKAGEVTKKESSSDVQPCFTFGAAVNAPPGSFTFGEKSEGTKEVSGFKFGIPASSETPKSDSSKKLPELQSLPKFSFGSKESSEKPCKPSQEMTKVLSDSKSGNDKESETKLLKEPDFKSGVGASITLPSRISTSASTKPSVVADSKPSFTFASTENKKESISANVNFTLGNNSPVSKVEDAKTTSVLFGVSSPPSNNMTTFAATTSGWSNNTPFKLDSSPKAPLFPRNTTSLPSTVLPSNNSPNNKSEELSKTGPTTFKFGDTSKSDSINKFQEVPKTVSSTFKFQETPKTSASIFSLPEKPKTTLTTASLPSSTITSNPFTGGFSALSNNKPQLDSEDPTPVPVSSQSITSEPSETKSGNSGPVFMFGSGSTPQTPAFNLIGQKQPTQAINTNSEELAKPFGNNIAATPNVFGSLMSSSKAPLFGSTTPSPSPGASVLPAATSENRSATSTAFVTPTSNSVFCSPNTTTVTSTNTTTATTVSSASSTFGSSIFGAAAPNFAAVGSTAPAFGSSTSAPLANPPAFGAAPSSSSVFGITSTPSSTPFSFSAGTKSTTEEQQANTQTNAPFVFGGGAATPAAQPFAFNSAPSKPTFSFGSSAVSSQPAAGTCASVPAPAAAPALGFSFGGTSKVATPFGTVQPATSIAGGSSNPFGSSSAVPVASIAHAAPSTFGAPLGESSAPASGTFGAPTFNFGSSQSNPGFSFSNNQAGNLQSNISQPAAFNFGQVPQPSTAPQVTFNPNMPPSFNFTGGATPQFTATPGVINTVPAANPMQRRFKKAVRRSQQPR